MFRGNLSHVPEASRFGISLNNICSYVFPELGKRLRLEDKIKDDRQAFIRTPKLMEFNFAGNVRYPFLGKADTWEWLYDTLGGRTWLICGSSDPFNLRNEGIVPRQRIGQSYDTGLAAYSSMPPEFGSDRVAFHPVIAFGKDHFDDSPIDYRAFRQGRQ
ncbi:MAG: hypothetical protein AAB583_04220 [Patescibacteria group bacterium]